ncbi:MAG: S-formylglutathione hydrolase [Rhodobacteraceae bacterium]|nr:S-formylglutathione hydrolase [Paracoccaceae bacterium]
METQSEHMCFGGTQGVYTHESAVCACHMTFGLFLPAEAQHGPVPVLWYLSGLTCTHENAMTKAGAQVWAAQHGVALVFPDTSPRGADVADDQSYDLGQGAGFYVNATQTPWASNFQMWDYIATELPALLAQSFAIDPDRQGITGHSMGGHGALTLAMGLPGHFKSVSAIAPIANPSQSAWGRKQLEAYLGPDETLWGAHDATLLMQDTGFDGPVLIDQGGSDQFLDLLKPEALSHAMALRRQQGTFRIHEGYDHSYFFVASVMEDHLDFHAEALYA